MATNTELNVGIRQNFATLGDRNFEPGQTSPVQYKCLKDGLDFIAVSNGALVKYSVGDTLPFDEGGPPATHYSATAVARLELYWNAGFIYPAT